MIFKKLIFYSVIFLFTATAILNGSIKEGKKFAIKGGKIYTITNGIIENGVILIEDGKIRSVGRNIEIPYGYEIIDAGDKIILPGLIDFTLPFYFGSNPSVNDEQYEEATPRIKALDTVDPFNWYYKRNLHAGITTVLVSPGNRNVIGGIISAVKVVGSTVDKMMIKDKAGLKGTTGMDALQGNANARMTGPTDIYARRPTSRMGVAWVWRDNFYKTKKFAENVNKGGEALNGYSIEERKNYTILKDVLEKELPVIINSRKIGDLKIALRLQDEFGIDLILAECEEGYKIVDEIAQRDIPVIIGPLFFYPRNINERFEGEHAKLNNAAVLAKAGVKLVLRTGLLPDSRNLLTYAAFLVKYGLKEEEALKAVTINPAEIFGIADRVGSIEAGKDADLVIFNGEPLDFLSKVEKVFVNGKIEFDLKKKKE